MRESRGHEHNSLAHALVLHSGEDILQGGLHHRLPPLQVLGLLHYRHGVYFLLLSILGLGRRAARRGAQAISSSKSAYTISSMESRLSLKRCHTSQPLHCTYTVPLSYASLLITRVVRSPHASHVNDACSLRRPAVHPQPHRGRVSACKEPTRPAQTTREPEGKIPVNASSAQAEVRCQVQHHPRHA
jgi:hypothetical protein